MQQAYTCLWPYSCSPSSYRSGLSMGGKCGWAHRKIRKRRIYISIHVFFYFIFLPFSYRIAECAMGMWEWLVLSSRTSGESSFDMPAFVRWLPSASRQERARTHKSQYDTWTVCVCVCVVWMCIRAKWCGSVKCRTAPARPNHIKSKYIEVQCTILATILGRRPVFISIYYIYTTQIFRISILNCGMNGRVGKRITSILRTYGPILRIRRNPFFFADTKIFE